VNVVADGAFEFTGAAVSTATQLSVGQVGEEAFDLIDPGGTGRREVQMESRATKQPSLDERGFVGSAVVEHEMDFCILRNVAIDGVEELAELDAAVTAVVLGDDLPGLDVEGCEEGRGAVPNVVVGPPLELTRPHGQDRLAPVQGLDLRLLVDAQDQRPVRGVQIEPDNAADLLDQQRIGRKLEVLGTMRPQAESAPDTSDAASAQARDAGKRPIAPVSCIPGLALQSQRDDLLDLRIADAPRSPRSWLIQQPVSTLLDEPPPPATNGLTRNSQPLRDIAVVEACPAREHHPGPQSQRLRGLPPTSPRLELLTLLCVDHQSRLGSSSSHHRSPCTGERLPKRYSSIISEAGHQELANGSRAGRRRESGVCRSASHTCETRGPRSVQTASCPTNTRLLARLLLAVFLQFAPRHGPAQCAGSALSKCGDRGPMKVHRRCVTFSPFVVVLLLLGCGSQPPVPTEPSPEVTPTPGPPIAYRVHDINPGVFSSNPHRLVSVAGRVFFAADDGFTGNELWVSDGSAAGTHLVQDTRPGLEGSDPLPIGSVGSTLFFRLVDKDLKNNGELWKSDGTSAGTVLVRAFHSDPSGGSALRGMFVFAAGDAVHGVELWRTDGSTEGTVLVRDISPGSRGSYPVNFTPMNGLVYFQALGGLWRTDGTTGGTVLVKDVGGAGRGGAVAASGLLFFTTAKATNGEELWRSDGTEAGTTMVKAFGAGPYEPANIGGTAFFFADGGVGRELWKSDGTETGTVMVRDIMPGRGSSFPSELMAVDSTLFFVASDGVHGSELWKSDGTEAGTVMVRDIEAGPEGSYPFPLAGFDGALMFAVDDGVNGHALWRSDGTAEGTVMLSDVDLDASVSESRSGVCVASGRFFFPASDAAAGTELWAFGPPPSSPPPATPVPTPPPGPNHPPTVADFYDYYRSESSRSVRLRLVDPDGDDLRWTITLSQEPGEANMDHLTCSSGCAAISTTDTSVSGVVRSDRDVDLVYAYGATALLTLTASDGRGGEVAPQTIRITPLY
jgi:ELWxxDGT repeat protein